MSGEMKPLAAVMSEVAALVKQRASGVQYIVTDDGRFAQLRLRGGHVDEISFKAKFSDDAILLLSQIGTARSRFEQVILTAGTSKHAPISEAMLNWMLGGFAGPAPTGAPVVKTINTPPPAKVPAPPGLSLPQRAAIEQIALTYLGPFASIVCEEALTGSTDIERSLIQIASNLSDREETARFLTEVRAALAKLG